MRIFAIDPGSTHSGWVIFNTDTKSVEHAGNDENQKIETLLESVARNKSVDALLVEKPQLIGQQIWEQILDTCIWVGRYWKTWIFTVGFVGIYFYSSQEVKRTLLGRMNVPNADSELRQFLLSYYGETGTKKAPGPTYGVSKHAWRALALVATFEEVQQQEQRGIKWAGTKKRSGKATATKSESRSMAYMCTPELVEPAKDCLPSGK